MYKYTADVLVSTGLLLWSLFSMTQDYYIWANMPFLDKEHDMGACVSWDKPARLRLVKVNQNNYNYWDVIDV